MDVSTDYFQVSLRNIYGYLKTVLIDRCKKVGAQYLNYEKSYFIQKTKYIELKKELDNLISSNNTDPQMKFKID